MLDSTIKALAQGKNFGTISVLLPDGRISTNVMWVDADDEHVLINTEVHRAKFKAMLANPQVTVMVWDAENPYHYGEVHGRVVSTVTGPEAKEHIDSLSRKYTGADYASPITSERVILKIAPDRQRVK